MFFLGKTSFCLKLAQAQDELSYFRKIVIDHTFHQPMYDEFIKYFGADRVDLVKEFNYENYLPKHESDNQLLYICDDKITSLCKDSTELCDLLIGKSHHFKMSVMLLVQSAFVDNSLFRIAVRQLTLVTCYFIVINVKIIVYSILQRICYYENS